MKTKKLILIIMCLLALSSLSYAQDSLECILQIDYTFTLSAKIIAGGDINADGYDEIIISRHACNGYGPVYIYLGSSQPDTIPDYLIYAEETNSYFGYSVSIAGDLNGDGYDDVVIGAPRYGDHVLGGRVYIYFGGEDFDTDPDLILTGYEYALDPFDLWFGTVVNTEGDFNDDGYNDLIVTSIGPSFFWNGQIDIFFGGENMDTELDVHIQGEISGDYGYSVSTGDINGDGYDDLVAGNGEFPVMERVRIFLGGENMNPFPDATIINEPSLYFGSGLAMNGDINNDGYDDLMVSQQYPDQVNIYLGNQDLILNLDYIIEYPSSVNIRHVINLFYSNINNDSYSDPVVAVEWYELFDYRGVAYIYYGNTVFDTIPEFTLIGEQEDDYFGGAGYDAGDVNNDGKDDILLGTKYSESNYANIYTLAGDSTGIDNNLQQQDKFMLNNYPNPFTISTTISFNLKEESHVNLSIYNIKGELITTLFDEEMNAGNDYKIIWNGRSGDKELANGIYFYKLSTNDKSFIKKMILLR